MTLAKSAHVSNCTWHLVNIRQPGLMWNPIVHSTTEIQRPQYILIKQELLIVQYHYLEPGSLFDLSRFLNLCDVRMAYKDRKILIPPIGSPLSTSDSDQTSWVNAYYMVPAYGSCICAFNIWVSSQRPDATPSGHYIWPPDLHQLKLRLSDLKKSFIFWSRLCCIFYPIRS